MSSGKPEPCLIRSPQDAEASACAWMRYWGYTDAGVTGGGADGGVDVRSSRAVAQVKAEVKPTTRPTVQQLAGVAFHEGVEAVFFSLAGFTDEASAWATEAGMALFSFDLSGEPQPLNSEAHDVAIFAGSESVVAVELKDRIQREIERQGNFTILGGLRSVPTHEWNPSESTQWTFNGSVPGGSPPPGGWKKESWLFRLTVSGPGGTQSWYSSPGYDAEDMVNTLIRTLSDRGHEIDDFAISPW